ncbi:hypothetical protein GD429_31655 [Burkholderia sp. BE17]|nr:hypothetical protein [Burkholderia sp. BE17]
MRFAQKFAGPAIQARYCGNGIKRWTRMPSNRAGDRNHLRNAARIYDDVLFRTELAPVRSPPGAGNAASSIHLPRSQSNRSCSRGGNSSNSRIDIKNLNKKQP